MKCEMPRILGSMSLLGNKSIKLLFGDHTVEVEVGSLDHFLQGIVVSEFSQILGDLSEVLK